MPSSTASDSPAHPSPDPESPGAGAGESSAKAAEMAAHAVQALADHAPRRVTVMVVVFVAMAFAVSSSFFLGFRYAGALLSVLLGLLAGLRWMPAPLGRAFAARGRYVDSLMLLGASGLLLVLSFIAPE